jgi:hypothetical protein
VSGEKARTYVLSDSLFSRLLSSGLLSSILLCSLLLSSIVCFLLVSSLCLMIISLMGEAEFVDPLFTVCART